MKEIAARKGCTPGQLALAWVHAQGEDVFPIPGALFINHRPQPNVHKEHEHRSPPVAREIAHALP